ncbi:nucleotidyl cyclase domain-containing protein [Streptomyces corynorhini]|uniref:Guanylate cyclase domain-containing protein n=1 Tax=Streptomyces corynorhini TaxID=2282652 RepID=A0A370B7R0_9ACTN|nr:hypothetical protein [Streptomyces corynorhini]RDG37848.1 hypothetical protein DVH02_12365 [Streptomyces corynorhini]
MDHDAMDVDEARYELVINIDARSSGRYDDVERPQLRARIYRVLETAFNHAKVARSSFHLEDRGDGVLLSVPSRIPVTRLLGLWLIELHEKLRDENRALRLPLGLRIGMHVGPVRHDDNGISGRAVDLACRLADSDAARRLLKADGADLVLVVSESLYADVVSGGGKFIEPSRYTSALLALKPGEGEVTAWFHLPGRPAPEVAVGPVEPTGSSGPASSGASATAYRAAPDALHDHDHDDDDDIDIDDYDGARYSVQGDMSQHRGNVYHHPVHIGRTTDAADRRKS